MKHSIPQKAIVYLDQVQVRNHPLPLWHAHWRGLVDTAFEIRQQVALPLRKGGLNLTLAQYENTQRGVETLRCQVVSKEFLRNKKAGVEAWISRLCYIINQKIRGFHPIEKLQRVVIRNTNYFAYYGTFLSNQMEIIIYVGSGEDIDGATVFHRKRSEVDETTRDWTLLEEYLPQTVWIKQTP